MSELALFQGLLEQRTHHLEALAEVDEEFLTYLIKVKAAMVPVDGQRPTAS